MNHFNSATGQKDPAVHCDTNSDLPADPVRQKTHVDPQAIDIESLPSQGPPKIQAQLPESANPDWLQTRLRYPAMGMCRR